MCDFFVLIFVRDGPVFWRQKWEPSMGKPREEKKQKETLRKQKKEEKKEPIIALSDISRPRLVFSRLLDSRGNLGNAKVKPTRKTCFSREKKAPGSAHLPSKTLRGGVSLKSTESLLYFHEK